MKKYKEPYYLVEFNSSICNFEIFINDLPAFIHNTGGIISSHYPINHLILESGKQIISVRILPLKGETSLRKDSFLKIKVFFFDAFTNDYSNSIEVFQYNNTDLDGDIPLIEISEFFFAEVPYALSGWGNSEEIKDCDMELISFYKHLYKSFEGRDVEKIYQIFRTKFNEINTAMYLDDSDDKKDLTKLFKQIDEGEMKLQPFPLNPLVILYNNKVGNVIRENREPVIYYKNNKTNEEFAFPVFVNMNDGDISVIR
ncbi:hypothetical protein SAMN02927921_03449 [Sinomicrobium oceani]|uniref:Uncharacterized protein n=1 Tax=Sinomicrobium oceani TaxID=1150368 RepID=A0A1K1RES4_9FLAO|nr:hypothetical protein [Sinomicrobium oceani]SFW70307.1 hypothetical protein SAMN02927921_03449 [Sinomicrobium oceani]